MHHIDRAIRQRYVLGRAGQHLDPRLADRDLRRGRSQCRVWLDADDVAGVGRVHAQPEPCATAEIHEHASSPWS